MGTPLLAHFNRVEVAGRPPEQTPAGPVPGRRQQLKESVSMNMTALILW
jgi:hypothetical protein